MFFFLGVSRIVGIVDGSCQGVIPIFRHETEGPRADAAD